ncbi:MAG: ankyrin repeat domain-containing protein [Candidatus Babeliales bacterium]
MKPFFQLAAILAYILSGQVKAMNQTSPKSAHPELVEGRRDTNYAIWTCSSLGVAEAPEERRLMDNSLFESARNNDSVKTQCLLDAGAKPTIRDLRGATPLHYAFYSAPSKTTTSPITPQILIAWGADPNAQDQRLNTPLHAAVRVCALSGIKTLINSGARVNTPNGCGETPLFLAVKKDVWQAIPILIEAGADINTADATGTTLLEISSKRSQRTRKALATTLAPQEIKHIIPALISLTNPCNDPGKKTIFGKDVALLIATQLIPAIMKSKITLGKKLLPQVAAKELEITILQTIHKMIATSPKMQSKP